MMAHFYCAATGGFYDDGLHNCVPETAVEISQAAYLDLLAKQAAGLVIVADADGHPIAVDPESRLTDEQRRARIVNRRNALLAASDRHMLPDFPIAAAERAAWVSYRQALRDFPETLDAGAGWSAPVWPTPPEESAPETPAG